MPKQRVIAYVDGFNLFYSSLKGTCFKWLDLASLCEFMLRPEQELVSVKYFSALVGSFKGDTSRTDRQRFYLEALSTNPKVEIKLGYFSTLVRPCHSRCCGKMYLMYVQLRRRFWPRTSSLMKSERKAGA